LEESSEIVSRGERYGTVRLVAQLVVCEKPSVANDVAAALGTRERFSKTANGWESANYIICAAAGHLVQMSEPQKYDPKYEKWAWEDLPIMPTNYSYQPRDQRAATRLKEIAGLIQDGRVTDVINACDAGREGELIFALIYQYSRSTKPVQRAWFNSMTSSAILDAFDHLRPGAEMAGLEAAARCRSEADWVVGMNATRAASCTLGGNKWLLSLGRVQTPTLAIIVGRDLEIENFVSTPYQQLRGDFSLDGPRKFSAWWRSSKETDAADRLEDPARATRIAAAVRNAGHGEIVDVAVRIENVVAPKLFDLTSLQREANKRYGMTAAKTLAAAQTLYESHKYLTYPRTDSQYITSDMAGGMMSLVAAVKTSNPALAAACAAAEAANLVSKIVNDKKVTDHHAIILTDTTHDRSVLTDDERRIYELVEQRFIAALLPPQVLERTVAWVRVDTTDGAEWFRAAGRHELEPGWRIAVLDAPKAAKKPKAGGAGAETDDDEVDGEDDEALCPLKQSEQPQVLRCEVLEKMTKPPSRHNEASLLGAMETAGKLVDDEDLAEALKERGLGTPATRAAVIDTLIDREYIERSGRALVGTDKGRGLILALGDHPLVRPDLTGEWEMTLRSIERLAGPQALTQRQSFNDAVRAFTTEIVSGFTGKTTELMRSARRSFGECPVPGCEGKIVAGARGWGCSSWKSKEETGCGFVFWKEQSGKKMTEKHLATYVAKLRSGEEILRLPGERIVLGPCPTCGQDVLERSKGWGCSSWKGAREPGCGYKIWKSKPDGTEMGSEEALELLQSGRTTPTSSVLGPCPKCGQDVLERPKGWGCSSWKSKQDTGCGFVIWKSNPDGSSVSTDDARTMLQAGQSNQRERSVYAQCPRCDGSIVDRGKFLGCDSWKGPKSKGCGVLVWKMKENQPLSDEQIADEIARQGAEAPPAKKKAARKQTKK
jgi:DNA topoisomerase-3